MAEEPPPPALAAYPPLIARILARRGISDLEHARAFFAAPSVKRPDPLLLPDMDLAIDRLRRAIAGKEQIAIYGDFDVDGITATAILIEGLLELGARVQPFIPNRFRDGYGVTMTALGHLAAGGVRLIVTVDCGITALEEAEYARRMGMDLIVLDHHEPGVALPRAIALVDPKRAMSAYPTKDLCSGALALRLLEALYEASGRALDRGLYLDLAALATVCDMVPLQGENRDLVREGLPAVARTRRPGLRALLGLSGQNATPDAETLGYRIGPRLNAAGRLEDASLALEILMTDDERRAATLAEALAQLNRKRQQMVEEALARAYGAVANEPDIGPVIVVGDPRISRGIVGLVASRLAETYGRPAFVYEESADGCVGSARGVGDFDVVLALRAAGDLLSRYGGHRAAGGFALPLENVAAFRTRLRQAAEQQLAQSEPTLTIEIDAAEPLRALDRTVLHHLERFAPCGVGNPQPVLASTGVSVVGQRAVGEGKHLMLDLRDRTVGWRAFAFGRGHERPGLGSTIDIVYSVEKGSRGYGPRLRLVDWRQSTTGVK